MNEVINLGNLEKNGTYGLNHQIPPYIVWSYACYVWYVDVHNSEIINFINITILLSSKE